MLREAPWYLTGVAHRCRTSIENPCANKDVQSCLPAVPQNRLSLAGQPRGNGLAQSRIATVASTSPHGAMRRSLHRAGAARVGKLTRPSVRFRAATPGTRSSRAPTAKCRVSVILSTQPFDLFLDVQLLDFEPRERV